MSIAKMLLLVCATSSRTSMKIGRMDSIHDTEEFRLAVKRAGNLQSSMNSSEASLHPSRIETSKPTAEEETFMPLAPAFLHNALRAVLGEWVTAGDIPGDFVHAKMFVNQLVKAADSDFERLSHEDRASWELCNSFTWRMLNQMSAAPPALENFMYATSVFSAVRTTFFDHKIQSAIAMGVTQIVYWGMALDTRAIRLQKAGVRVYEVDDASALDIKVKAMKEKLGVHPYPANLIRLADSDDPVQAFLAAAISGDKIERLRSEQAVLFVWEGRSMYTSVPQSVSLLKFILGYFRLAYVLFDSLDPEVETADFSIIQETLRSPDLYPGKLSLSHIMQIATETSGEIEATIRSPKYALDTIFNSSFPDNDVFSDFQTEFRHMRFNVINKGCRGPL